MSEVTEMVERLRSGPIGICVAEDAADLITRLSATDTEAMRLLGEISTACEINQGFLPSDLLARIDALAKGRGAVLGDDVG